MWYRYSQFTTNKGDDWWVKRILNIKYPNWQNSPNAYEMFNDVVANLSLYKTQYKDQILRIENLKQFKPKPSPTEQPVQESPQQQQAQPVQKLPPIHDNCRCYIETMPGGRQIWQFADNCCDYCRALANEFNHTQFMSFGI